MEYGPAPGLNLADGAENLRRTAGFSHFRLEFRKKPRENKGKALFRNAPRYWLKVSGEVVTAAAGWTESGNFHRSAGRRPGEIRKSLAKAKAKAGRKVR